MKVAEIYKSTQGEGILASTESVFVRASGCNLRCRYCDTPLASFEPRGDDLSVDQIVEQVEQLGGSHVVLTGGEPMLYAELIPLGRRLREKNRHITVETAGTLYLPVACDLMSISPKLSNSTPSPADEPKWSPRHDRTRDAPDVIRRLVREYPYQIKFVKPVQKCLGRDAEAMLDAEQQFIRPVLFLNAQLIDRIAHSFCRHKKSSGKTVGRAMGGERFCA